ncbi:MAG: glucosamine--fructose-6-phosphate aminotransferase (isomerizing) [Saprospiraceae bacterium]|jgi:glucosamine--fructose-6-phosphate aminotransferase (isomerizing)
MIPKLEEIRPLLKNIDRIIITACGTSWHSGLVAEYLIEKYARMNVEVEYASEFSYKSHNIGQRDLVIGISQSGETADTLSALEIAKSQGTRTMAVVNGVNSSIARMVDKVIYLDAGMEIGVASTKVFTLQLSVILLLTMVIAKERASLCESELRKMMTELIKLPTYVSEILATTEEIIKDIAYGIAKSSSALFLGRGISYPIAIEGALKLKEISYIHAEGYPSDEMKHGPIALVERGLPVIAIINNDSSTAKIISNIQEVKARNATVIIVKNMNTEVPEDLADHTINIPDAPAFLNPIIQSIPLQLLSYYVTKIKGCNIDQPRNLAKSVTVE